MIAENRIDFIGDIHGHADELEDLLHKLGYSKLNGSYKHPDRTAFFVGDYIDRGPEIPKTLNIVRSMVESGHAMAIMGNHEYNAICFHQKRENGCHLREHSIKNILQHVDTLEQFKDEAKKYEEYIEWFKTLPLFYETEGFRVVHASWDHGHIGRLRGVLDERCLTDELLPQTAQKGSDLYTSVDDTLKGKELELPDDHEFKDEDGHRRTAVRIKWWEDPVRHTWKSLAVHATERLSDKPFETPDSFNSSYYDEYEKPVFFGHYWLKGTPSVYRHNICCLDYSVAKEGKLVAYRYDGEKRLTNEKLVFV